MTTERSDYIGLSPRIIGLTPIVFILQYHVRAYIYGYRCDICFRQRRSYNSIVRQKSKICVENWLVAAKSSMHDIQKCRTEYKIIFQD